MYYTKITLFSVITCVSWLDLINLIPFIYLLNWLNELYSSICFLNQLQLYLTSSACGGWLIYSWRIQILHEIHEGNILLYYQYCYLFNPGWPLRKGWCKTIFNVLLYNSYDEVINICMLRSSSYDREILWITCKTTSVCNDLEFWDRQYHIIIKVYWDRYIFTDYISVKLYQYLLRIFSLIIINFKWTLDQSMTVTCRLFLGQNFHLWYV